MLGVRGTPKPVLMRRKSSSHHHVRLHVRHRRLAEEIGESIAHRGAEWT